MSVADIQATRVLLFVGGPGKASTFTVPKDQTITIISLYPRSPSFEVSQSLPLFSKVKQNRESDQTWGQECQLRALLIGGGGQGDNSGGGSGLLKYINMSVADIQATKVHLFVGGPGKASTFTVPKDQTHGMEATALPGKATN